MSHLGLDDRLPSEDQVIGRHLLPVAHFGVLLERDETVNGSCEDLRRTHVRLNAKSGLTISGLASAMPCGSTMVHVCCNPP